jgi:hypothetical protein
MQRTYSDSTINKYRNTINNNNGNKLFAHNGVNYAFRMNFNCTPDEKLINIIMINHNPK